jgi:hypothetical protein
MVSAVLCSAPSGGIAKDMDSVAGIFGNCVQQEPTK